MLWTVVARTYPKDVQVFTHSTHPRGAGQPTEGFAPPIIHDVLSSPGRPLDPAEGAHLEAELGQDFSRVRVHTDRRAGESAQAIGAIGYTVGHHIVFGPDSYQPRSELGRRRLAHELMHVTQQTPLSAIPGRIPLGDQADFRERDAQSVAGGLNLTAAAHPRTPARKPESRSESPIVRRIAENSEDPLPHGQSHPLKPVDPGLAVIAGKRQYVIYDDEVRVGGTISWLARNPGNIRSGEAYGAYPGKHISAGKSGHFAVFPDEQTGFAAISQVLRGYGKITVAKAMAKYAPSGDGNNDPGRYARTVAQQMGVSTATLVDSLNDDQLTEFATAIRKVEGWRPGEVYSLDDVTLPSTVRQAIRR